ncbi:MAG TPA: hypothetical protein VF459_00645 [Caulobacteraceae bacterium]
MSRLAATTPTDASVSLSFYAGMAALCMAVAVVGFMPTFFIPLAQGQFHRAPLFYVHGLLFFAWTMFFFTQSWLAMKGRTLPHREWGVLGAALATSMVFSVMAVTVVRLNQTPPIPAGPGSASFAWVDVSNMVFFGACVVLGLANTRRPNLHKRLMLLATLSLLNAPTARWGTVFFPGPAGGPPPLSTGLLLFFTLPSLVLMLIPAVYDWRVERRISLVYLAGIPLFALLDLSWNLPAFGGSPWWLAIADRIKHLPG